MKFSLNWLGEFVELPNDTAELAELLTLAGVEIEGIENRGANFENVVVAQIKLVGAAPERRSAERLPGGRRQRHAAPDRLRREELQSRRQGSARVPGAVLPNDFKIKASKLRGVESQGMLCSAKELALSEESAGLLILSPESENRRADRQSFSLTTPSSTSRSRRIAADLLSHYRARAGDRRAHRANLCGRPRIAEPRTSRRRQRADQRA